MSTFEQWVSGFKEGVDETQRIKQTMAELIRDEFQKLLDSIVSEARSNLQNNMHVVTGQLLSSIKVIDIGVDGMSGDVGTELFYAVYIEDGRGPVRPIRAKVLHWVDPQTGEDVFSMYAKATDPSPFLEPAVLDKTQGFTDIVAQRMDNEGVTN